VKQIYKKHRKKMFFFLQKNFFCINIHSSLLFALIVTCKNELNKSCFYHKVILFNKSFNEKRRED